MAFETVRALVQIHPILDEYKDALRSLGIEPMRYPLKERLFNRKQVGFAQPDNVYRNQGKISISPASLLPREVLLHETAHILLDHLLGDEKEHEMEAALVAHFAARRLGWNAEASSAARYARNYVRRLRESGSASGESGNDIVLAAYAPDGATQIRIQNTVNKLVSAFQSIKKS